VTQTPADTPPPTGLPTSTVPPVPPVPNVPYGGASGAPATVSAPITAGGVAKGFGQVAVAWGIRAIVVLVIRAIFRAIFRG
jgi:hypothetical protein